MTAQLLDGKATTAAIRADLRSRVTALADRGIQPALGTLLVGEDMTRAMLLTNVVEAAERTAGLSPRPIASEVQ